MFSWQQQGWMLTLLVPHCLDWQSTTSGSIFIYNKHHKVPPSDTLGQSYNPPQKGH